MDAWPVLGSNSVVGPDGVSMANAGINANNATGFGQDGVVASATPDTIRLGGNTHMGVDAYSAMFGAQENGPNGGFLPPHALYLFTSVAPSHVPLLIRVSSLLLVLLLLLLLES